MIVCKGFTDLIFPKPEGTSTEIIFLNSFISFIILLYGSRGSPIIPEPNKQSMISEDERFCFSWLIFLTFPLYCFNAFLDASVFGSFTLYSSTSYPLSRRISAATKPSPALFPWPQTNFIEVVKSVNSSMCFAT